MAERSGTFRGSAVALRLHAAARRHWTTWLLLGALVGVLAGAVAGAAAAARRTSTAPTRFADEAAAVDVAFGCAESGCADTDALAAALQGVAGVEAVAPVAFHDPMFLRPDGSALDTSGDACLSGPGAAALVTAPDGRFGETVNRRRIVEGRAPAAPTEVVVAESLADRVGLALGDEIVVAEKTCPAPPLRGKLALTVVGIGRSPGDVPTDRGVYWGLVQGPPELADLLAPLGIGSSTRVAVRLRPGVTAADVRSATDLVLTTDESFGETQRELGRSVDDEAGTLYILAAVGAIAAAALLAPVLARNIRVALVDARTLRSVGATWRELAGESAGHGLAIGLAATPAIGAVVAATSAFTPIGRAALLEPDPGIALDVAVIAAAAAITIVFAVMVSTAASWRLGLIPRHRPWRRSSPVARLATWARFPPPLVTGTRMAFEPRHDTARVPVRSGLLGVAVAATTVIGVLAYRADLHHLQSTPRLRGWNWDDVVLFDDEAPGVPPTVESITEAVELARRTPGVAAASMATFWSQPGGDALFHVAANGRREPTVFIAFDTGPGAIPATITDGRPPLGPAEIALNAGLLDTLDVEVGDEIEIMAGSRAFPVSVVGRAVVPTDRTETDHVAVITLDAFRRFQPDHPGDWLLVRLEPGGRIDEVVNTLREGGYPVAGNLLAGAEDDVSVLLGSPLDDAAESPVLLGVLMTVAGLVVLVHLVAVASGLRRRELGILRVLGFRRRQVVGSVAALAGALVLAAFAIGLPAGLVVGWLAWQGTADRLDVLAEAVIPWTAIGVALVAGLALGVAAAAWPARTAARVRTAEVLRSE